MKKAVKGYQGEEEKIVLPQDPQFATLLLEAIKHLKQNPFFKTFRSSVIELNLSRCSSRLKNENEPTEVFRLQGGIQELEKLDLDKLELFYDNIVSRQKGQINKQ